MLKANTVEQLHILRFLQENFYIDALKIELLDRNKVKITDSTGESAEFAYNKTLGRVEMLPQKDERRRTENEQSNYRS